jgi:tetratricopeptide (TPR) repeat protein
MKTRKRSAPKKGKRSSAKRGKPAPAREGIRKTLKAAQSYAEKGALGRTLMEYLKLLRADPKDANVRLRIGDLHLKRGERRRGADCYRQAAVLLAKQGFDAKAVAAAKQALTIDPDCREMRVQLGELYQRIGRKSEAKHEFQTALRLCRDARSKGEADELRRRISALESDDVVSPGRAKDGGEAEDWMSALLEAAKQLPSDYDVLEELASAYEAIGDPETAGEVFREIAELNTRGGHTDRARIILQRWVPAIPIGEGVDADPDTDSMDLDKAFDGVILNDDEVALGGEDDSDSHLASVELPDEVELDYSRPIPEPELDRNRFDSVTEQLGRSDSQLDAEEGPFNKQSAIEIDESRKDLFDLNHCVEGRDEASHRAPSEPPASTDTSPPRRAPARTRRSAREILRVAVGGGVASRVLRLRGAQRTRAPRRKRRKRRGRRTVVGIGLACLCAAMTFVLLVRERQCMPLELRFEITSTTNAQTERFWDRGTASVRPPDPTGWVTVITGGRQYLETISQRTNTHAFQGRFYARAGVPLRMGSTIQATLLDKDAGGAEPIGKISHRVQLPRAGRAVASNGLIEMSYVCHSE